MEGLLGREVQTHGASVGLVEPVRHIPQLLGDVPGKLGGSLKDAIFTREQVRQHSRHNGVLAVEIVDLRPSELGALLGARHLGLGESAFGALGLRHRCVGY